MRVDGSSNSLLITGGAGFIGSNFVYYWLKHHPEDRIIILDALTYAGNLPNLDEARKLENVVFVQGDIRDKELVGTLLRQYKIEIIVHFAAESHVDRSIHTPDDFVETNVLGTHNLLKMARKIWLEEGLDLFPSQPYSEVPCRFHHVSTDEVYGTLGPDDQAFTEQTPYAPNSPYAASKASSDHLVRAYYKTYGLPITISNCSNNFGPYQFPEKLIPLMIINMLEGKELPVYGDGRQIRDWLYVEDHCRGIELILESGRTGETYNIGGNCEIANIDLVHKLTCLLDSFCPGSPYRPHASLISYVRDRPGHDRRYAINSQKIYRELGFDLDYNFFDALANTVLWYIENESWWRDLMNEEYSNWIASHYERESFEREDSKLI